MADACGCDDSRKRHIMRTRRQLQHLLAVKGDADPWWAEPMLASQQIAQCPIVIASAHADALTLKVETHQRHEDEIKLPGRQYATGLWFADAIATTTQAAVKGDELHAIAAVVGDAWQKDMTAAS